MAIDEDVSGSWRDDLELALQRSDGPGILALLKSWDEASIFDGCLQYMSPGWGRAELPRLAEWLMARTSQVPPRQAVEDLISYVDAARSQCVDVMPIVAGQVLEQRSLGGGCSIAPVERGVSGPFWNSVKAKAMRAWRDHKPLSVLVRAREYPRIHLDPGKSSDRTNPEYPGIQGLDDVRLLIALVFENAALSLGHWTGFPEHVPAISPRGGSVRDVRPQAYAVDNPVDTAKLATLHESWLRLAERAHVRYRVSLGRLNWTLSRPYRSELGATSAAQVEAAIDMGIALESIFLSALGADRGELSFRLRLYASRLLRHNRQARAELSRDLGRFYRVRSAAVHTGTIPGDVDGSRPGALIHVAVKTVREALLCILLNGEPDWHELPFT